MLGRRKQRIGWQPVSFSKEPIKTDSIKNAALKTLKTLTVTQTKEVVLDAGNYNDPGYSQPCYTILVHYEKDTGKLTI